MEHLKRKGKMGPLLIQLPPRFGYGEHDEALKSFLRILPHDFRFAVEFRDSSWLRPDVMNALSRYEVAYTVVDGPILSPEIHVTTDFSYVRWHGKGRNPWYNYHYGREELELWKDRLIELKDRVERVYGYFNNHFHGYAVHNCLQVLEMLGIITERQRRILERVERALLKPQPPSMTLAEFMVPEEIPEKPEELLKILIDEKRLRRAKQIKPERIRVEEMSETHLQGRVKDYMVIIDLEKKLIIHDCADWAKIGARLRLCKHLAAFLLSLNRENSKKILQDMVRNRAQWSFRNV